MNTGGKIIAKLGHFFYMDYTMVFLTIIKIYYFPLLLTKYFETISSSLYS